MLYFFQKISTACQFPVERHVYKKFSIPNRMNASILFFCLFLSSFYARCQNYFGEYRLENGLCSTTFTLWQDSTFFVESRCEGRSNITYGTFSIQHQQLVLKPIPGNQAPLIHQVTWLSGLEELDIKAGDISTPNLVLSDKSGRLIREMEIILYNPDGTYFSFDGSQQANWKTYPLGMAEEVYFPGLSNVYRKSISVKVPPRPDNKYLLKITFNTNSVFFTYNQVVYRANKWKETPLYFQHGKLIGRENGEIFEFEKIKPNGSRP